MEAVVVAEEAVAEEEEAEDAVEEAAPAVAVHSVQEAEWAQGKVQFGHMFGFLPGIYLVHN